MPPRRSRLSAPLIAPDLLIEAARLSVPEQSYANLARELAKHGLDQSNAERNLSRWREGDSEPEYRPTLALLKVAGWLDDGAIRRASGEAAIVAAAKAEERARRLAEREAQPQRKRRSA